MSTAKTALARFKFGHFAIDRFPFCSGCGSWTFRTKRKEWKLEIATLKHHLYHYGKIHESNHIAFLLKYFGSYIKRNHSLLLRLLKKKSSSVDP